ncbi:MAG: DegT/DnrJ/EryC1/StrS family aminotransferase [Puniceicoccales bacterium]
MPERIFLSPPEVYPGEREALLAAFDSGWIAPVGPAIASFENAFVEHMGGGYAVALSSGTAALHLALLQVGVKPGDEVLCSTLTFTASANAIRYCGAKPVFIDSEEESWNMNPALLAQALEERETVGKLPAAVELVHAYGQCANVPEIVALCHRYGVPLIEDAAEALGALSDGRSAGSFGRASAFSFNGNKIITSSGGGMLWTADEAFAVHVRKLATQAREPDRGYLHKEIGYNYRMSNLLAALGEAQLKALPERILRRRQVFARYQEALSDLPGLNFMPEVPCGVATRWLTCATIDPDISGTNATVVMDALEAQNIESRPIWRPMHCQPVNAGCQVFGGSVSERLSETGLSLPSSGQLTEDAQSRVIATIRACW